MKAPLRQPAVRGPAVKKCWRLTGGAVTRPSLSALRTASAPTTGASSTSQQADIDFPDPEAKYRRYGKHFGAKPKWDWLENAPRVRVRTAESRQREELLELAVLNERLAGTMEPWEARLKLEYLRSRRRNWEQIYEYVTKQDVAATLSVIEEASRKVDEALSEEARERTSVSMLQRQLVQLQAEVSEAQQKLQLTQGRVEQNLKRIDELKTEAASLERMRSMASTANTSTAVLEANETSTSYSIASASTSTLTRPRATQKKSKRLQSSLELEDSLKNFWYPAEFSSKLDNKTLIPFEIFGVEWVLFRDENGKPACIQDQCAHRACPLSLGKVVNGQVQCAYHGWEFNGKGSCTKMPSTAMCRGVGVTALPCAEKDGFIWVWPGSGAPAEEVPDYTRPPEGFEVHAEIMVDVPVEHGLLMENLLDLAHAPFTHTTTFARGWPIPDFVKFHATKMLSGNWDPYPINMAFQPPCMVLSLIGLAQPGQIMRGFTAEQCQRHLHQLHVCMPSKKGHTRLLYRMSLDFMHWAKHIPFIDRIWKQVAAQVLGEDLVLVKGQQDRLAKGGDTWANPVSYDKLAVRYRRWRNSVAEGDFDESARQLASSGGASMSAGELFRLEQEEEGAAGVLSCPEQTCMP